MMLFDHMQAGPSPMPATTTAMEGHSTHSTHGPQGSFGHGVSTNTTTNTAAAYCPPHVSPPQDEQQRPPPHQRIRRKRKADAQDAHNERLSKRMSLLNLEQNGPKLYVPVEQAQIQFPQQTPGQLGLDAPPSAGTSVAAITEEQPMQLDDTSHKVYIYNLDDELSSENESEPEGEGRLVFLTDIEKHLRANRIPLVPRPVLPNEDGELAGMQLVLYSDGPSSLTVPEEQDSVRKAILEARARLRQKQAEERGTPSQSVAASKSNADLSRTGKVSFATPVRVARPEGAYADMQLDGQDISSQTTAGASAAASQQYDPDAMDID